VAGSRFIFGFPLSPISSPHIDYRCWFSLCHLPGNWNGLFHEARTHLLSLPIGGSVGGWALTQEQEILTWFSQAAGRSPEPASGSGGGREGQRFDLFEPLAATSVMQQSEAKGSIGPWTVTLAEKSQFQNCRLGLHRCTRQFSFLTLMSRGHRKTVHSCPVRSSMPAAQLKNHLFQNGTYSEPAVH
jgi:hypothetical protein